MKMLEQDFAHVDRIGHTEWRLLSNAIEVHWPMAPGTHQVDRVRGIEPWTLCDTGPSLPGSHGLQGLGGWVVVCCAHATPPSPHCI